ncbi:MAG: DNA recombination protein RmuC [Planctomycetes bacterium]|nr:DNA recombination protein RmuC [Planctomycetota bacterium]
MDYLSLGLGIVIGCFLGGIAVFAFFGRKSSEDGELEIVRLQTQLEAQEKHAKEMRDRMNESFAKISQETVDQNSKNFLQLAETKFAPFKELLSKTQLSVQDLETKRVKAYTELESATKQIIEETTKLETALRRPDHRGRWGEVGLRNVVEFAGMTDQCDFDEQVVTTGEQSLRPDMVINMPGGGHLVVDSKLPLEHYLNAIEEPEKAGEHLDKHAKALEVHVNALSNKAYWEQFDRAPSFVVMFVNVESALVAALERNPDLHNKALSKKVLLTSPATLVALLQAAAFGWRQDSMAKNAEDIAKAGQELYDRLAKFQSHLAKIGNRLHQATESYNSAVGSFTTRLEPGAKRLSELHSTGGKELPVTEPVDIEPRSLE